VALANGIFVAVFLEPGGFWRDPGRSQAAEAIAGGDLTREDLKIRSQDELGDLTTAINTHELAA